MFEQNRFFTMAEAYDRMCRVLVPGYDFLQNEVLDLSGVAGKAQPVVVDLGAGSGILLEKVLERNSAALCYGIDYSSDFLKVAQSRLARFGASVRLVSARLEEHWEDQVEHQPDCVFSMSAIHHLTTEEKKNLYRRIFVLLKPSGWFFNIDETRSISETAYRNSLFHWLEHVQKMATRVPPEQEEWYRQWNVHFDGWRRRNVDNWDAPKVKGDDLHESFLDQAHWLEEIGYQDVDVFVKYHLWALFGGRKPA